MARPSILHPNRAPRLIPREAAAELHSVSPGTFDQMVKNGKAPKPKVIGRRRLWDVRELEEAIAKLPHEGDADEEPNPWDEVVKSGEN